MLAGVAEGGDPAASLRGVYGRRPSRALTSAQCSMTNRTHSADEAAED